MIRCRLDRSRRFATAAVVRRQFAGVSRAIGPWGAPLVGRTAADPPSPALMSQRQRRHYHAMACSLPQNPSSFRSHPQNNLRSFSSVFVSKHNQSLNVTAHDILDYSQAHGVATHDARTTHTHVILRECPFCPKPTRNKADNLYKLYVQVGGGAYFCHRCGAHGSWFDYKIQLGGGGSGGGMAPLAAAGAAAPGAAPHAHGRAGPRSLGSAGRGTAPNAPSPYGTAPTPPRAVPPLPMPPKRLQALYSNDLFAEESDAGMGRSGANADSSSSPSVLKYLVDTRGLLPTTLRKYGVGRAQYTFLNDQGHYEKQDCVTFSWITSLRHAQTQEALRGSKFPVHEYLPRSRGAAASSATTNGAGSPQMQPTSISASDSPNAEDTEALLDQIYVTRRIKARALSNKAWQRLDPPGGPWGFFGYHTIPQGAREVVLCEGEYDAMAVWQATGRPAISLPNGCRSLPVETLPMLEDFERIYLWMDNDAPGQEGAELFSKKLGMERCFIVRPTKSNIGITTSDATKLPKDANEALLMGCDLQSILDDAKLTPHEQILTFDELRLEVLHEIMHPDKYVGTPLPSLPQVTNKIKGLRRGELTVLTGPTGSGKTTFLGQMSLDLAEQDVNVLWGSFEIKNTRLIHKLMQQFAREPLPIGDAAMTNKLEAIANRFSQLPLYFLKFHGGSDVDDVLDAMEYAVYVNDCQHIILDNMQFMISRKSTNSTWDKFDVQDAAIEKFRKFATDRNVHVCLVCHPRKEAEDTRLSISSFYGSAKATQEADTVLILQNERGKKFLEVKKNRFNGDLGYTPLFFDRKSGRYTEEQPYKASGRTFSTSSSQNRSDDENSDDDASGSEDAVRHSPYPNGSKKLMPKIEVPKGSLIDRVMNY